MYNGYRFSDSEVSVYNPFSTINVLADSKFRDYWSQTGTPTFLMKEVARVHFDITSFENKISRSQENISNYRSGSEDIVPLLFQTGYLTIKEVDNILGGFILGFPNNEVRMGFLRYLVEITLRKLVTLLVLM
jgi:hypothetical protein